MKSEMKLIDGNELLITDKKQVIEYVKQCIDERILDEVDYILKHNKNHIYHLDRLKMTEYRGLYIQLLETHNGNGIQYPTITYQVYKPTFATIKEELYDELHTQISREVGICGHDARFAENNGRIDEERRRKLFNNEITFEELLDLEKPLLRNKFIKEFEEKIKEYNLYYKNGDSDK